MLKRKIKNEQVIDFLEKNPNFFIENPNILEKINFPLYKNKSENGDPNVITFKDWIIENLKNKQKNIIENARYNFITQKKIHESIIIIIKKKNATELLSFLIDLLPKTFELEVINIVSSNKKICDNFNLIFRESNIIDEIYGTESQLIMDATENYGDIFNGLNKKVYSNAIFSLAEDLFGSKSLLVFGSSDKHFIDNKAYDLIFFLANIVKEKLGSFSYDR